MQYFGADGLGSVRQIFDASAVVVGSTRYDPYGNLMSQSGATSVFAFAGEQYDATGLTYLRARYYSAAQGRFTTRDVWEGDPNAPMSYNAWNYTNGNPVNFADPSGQWRWALTSGTGIYHEEIEDYYEASYNATSNPNMQVEFRIPPAKVRHPDMFNSLTRGVYEIEPVYNANEGMIQVVGYVTELNDARRQGLLQGQYLDGSPYNWNGPLLFYPGTGLDLMGRDGQRKMRMTMPGFMDLDLVADYAAPGLVLYWLEFKLRVPVTVPARVPNSELLRDFNWSPRRLAPVPVRVIDYDKACGTALIAVGTTMIVVTVVSDLSVIGTIDDVVTLPAGAWFINMGARLAGYVPVAATP